jgi:hypothetical protein
LNGRPVGGVRDHRNSGIGIVFEEFFERRQEGELVNTSSVDSILVAAAIERKFRLALRRKRLVPDDDPLMDEATVVLAHQSS